MLLRCLLDVSICLIKNSVVARHQTATRLLAITRIFPTVLSLKETILNQKKKHFLCFIAIFCTLFKILSFSFPKNTNFWQKRGSWRCCYLISANLPSFPFSKKNLFWVFSNKSIFFQEIRLFLFFLCTNVTFLVEFYGKIVFFVVKSIPRWKVLSSFFLQLASKREKTPASSVWFSTDNEISQTRIKMRYDFFTTSQVSWWFQKWSYTATMSESFTKVSRRVLSPLKQTML